MFLEDVPSQKAHHTLSAFQLVHFKIIQWEMLQLQIEFIFSSANQTQVFFTCLYHSLLKFNEIPQWDIRSF